MLDIADIPRGVLALDLLIKEAWVEVLSAGTVQGGRYLILFGGDVESTQLAFAKAEQAAGDALFDRVCLPWAEQRIGPAILDGTRREPTRGDSLGMLQASAAPTMIRAVDAALKGAQVDLVEFRVADGLGGRAIATLWGESYDIEAAIELAERTLERGRSDGWSSSVVRNTDPTVRDRLAVGTRFYQEWRG
ncbi:MAG: microcompartment protein CcmL/EutN [Kiritimatiellia bacterium]|jgi:microcompartment protein CcmL/EutN